MAGTSPGPDSGDRTGREPAAGAPPRTPRWVKVFGLLALIAVLLLAAMLFVGGDDHGPGRHASSGETADQAAPFRGAAEDAPPEAGRG